MKQRWPPGQNGRSRLSRRCFVAPSPPSCLEDVTAGVGTGRFLRPDQSDLPVPRIVGQGARLMAACREGCENYKAPKRAFCKPCWDSVPLDVQEAVTASWKAFLDQRCFLTDHHDLLAGVARGIGGEWPWETVRAALAETAFAREP